MTILEAIIGSKTIVKYAVSNELIQKTHKAYNGKYNTTRYYFYFKNRTDFIKITNGIFVLEKDLPDEIKDKIQG
jgi:hypothetical protein